MNDQTPFLEPNFFVDSDHPAIVDYARDHAGPPSSPRDQAVRLYYAIRDGFRYNPWRVLIQPEAFRASSVLLRDREEGGHCIDKANLLAACCRAVGIASRLHFANVRNHIGTEELERQLGTSLLVFHGYTELCLGDRWVAATPAFNKELCDHLGVDTLEFDGESDSIFQPYDRAGGKFMEYVHDYGTYPDVPFDLMVAEWRKHYRGFFESDTWPAKPAVGEGA
ncbi:MAG: transglutaminase family protein [Deltaproteobacteria bacterium]|jgi:transglutaminase-like putative cysteine protease|nr:transglutaminase family protein [Deltaproteobacteria bacterium]MBW2535081.1 transglutaminase family protein [Deltaproteobacteria bacterium]